MNGKKVPVARDQVKIRSNVPEKSLPVLNEWADLEGRSREQHTGVLLRRLAVLFTESPDKLEEIGLLTPHIKAVA